MRGRMNLMTLAPCMNLDGLSPSQMIFGFWELIGSFAAMRETGPYTLIVHQESIGGPVSRIAANEPMSSQNPNIIWLGDSPSRFIQGASVIRFIRPRIDIF